MASYQASGKGSPGRNLRSEMRKYQHQPLPDLGEEHFTRLASAQLPQKANRKATNSRTYVSSIEPVQLKRTPGYSVVENSYQLKPVVPFPSSQVTRLAQDTLKSYLEGCEYDEGKCRQFSVDICDEIQRRTKMLNVPRYKYVCYVHIGQIMGQDMVIASRCLWDTEVDSFASASYKNKHLFATAIVDLYSL